MPMLSQPGRRLPPLSELRLRRLRARLPLEILARDANVPFSTIARAEREEKDLSPDQRERVERVLAELEHETGPAAA